MLHRLPVLLVTGLAFFLTQTADLSAARKKAPWRSWTSHKNENNPLVGKIWDVSDKTYLTPFELARKLAIFDYILLGEIHDNPDHHRLQAWLIRNIVYQDRHPAIVMEMINLDQAQIVADYRKRRNKAWREGYQEAKRKKKLRQWRRAQAKLRRGGPSARAEKFGAAIGWEKSGWPDWKFYQPIARAAFAEHLPLKAGDPAKTDIRIVSQQGFAALGNAREKFLALDLSLGPKRQSDLLSEIKSSHCNLLPEKLIPKMANVQRYRDAVMADQLLNVGITTGAVLIAGNGHVRQDRGVPWYIQKRDPYATQASLMIIETDEKTSKPDDLIAKDPDGKPVADFVWYTPSKKRADPCKGLAKHFAKSPGKKKMSAAEVPSDDKRKDKY